MIVCQDAEHFGRGGRITMTIGVESNCDDQSRVLLSGTWQRVRGTVCRNANPNI